MKKKINMSNPENRENTIRYQTFLLEREVKSARKYLPEVLANAFDNNLDNLQWLLEISGPLDIRDALRILQSEHHVTSRVKRVVNRQFYKQDAHRLQLWLLRYSADAFREIFDVTHPKPDKWPLTWFQNACYGGQVPDDSMIGKARALKGKDAQEAAEIISEGRIPWHYVRSKDQTQEKEVFEDSRTLAALFKTEGMRFIVDNAERLAEIPKEDQNEVRKAIIQAAQGRVKLNFVDPLLAARIVDVSFRPAFLELAQSLLEKTYLDEAKIGAAWIVGDISGSMDLTIPYATFVAALFAARIPSTRMFLFTIALREIAPPENVVECMAMVDKLKADGGTNIGLIFNYILQERQVPRTLILISDGQDNDTARFRKIYNQFMAFLSETEQRIRIVFLHIGGPSSIKLKSSEFIRIIQKDLDARNYARNIDEILAEITYNEPQQDFWEQFEAVELAFVPKIVVDECAICGSPLTSDIIPLACGHKYHGACLKNYWELIGKKQCVCHCSQTHECPTCGAPVDASQAVCNFCKTKFVLS